MQTTDKLTRLIEQAASAISMLSPTDMPEIENLQAILDQIKQNIAELDSESEQLLEQAQGTTRQATAALQEIFKKETQDTTESIEIITQAVSTLQGIIEEINQNDVLPEVESTETEVVADVETEAVADIEAETTPDIETEAIADTETEVVADVETETVADIGAETTPGIETEAVADIEAETAPDIEAEATAGTEVEATVDIETEAIVDTETEAVADTDIEAVADIEAETTPDTETEAIADTETEAVADTETEEAADVETETEEAISADGNEEKDTGFLLDFITEANEHIESAEAELLKLENKPDDKEAINQIFRGFHTIKGLAAFLNLSEIGQLAHSAENLLDLGRKDELALAGDNIDIVFESIDMMKKLVANLEVSVHEGKPVTAQKSLPRLLAKIKAPLEKRNLANSMKSPAAQKKDRELDKVLVPKKDSETQSSKTQVQIHSSDEKIKVSTARLDSLVNMVGELVVAQLMVSEEVNTTETYNHNLCRKVAHQNKIIRELQQLSMSIRMVPIGGVFQKMARLVRDLSHKSGKQINFFTTGDETELDRTVVDKIADPLVHMIRNAIDHGIEPPEKRTKNGKKPTGLIQLRAFHEAGNIVIEIEDDGKGLEKERILKKALENGIITTEQELNDEDILKLIFHAGFSTAEKVTSVSGRGVGMDVVKKNVEALHGRIDINTAPGKGTTFTIRMPLTLAIIDGQIIRIGNNRYILPINSIERSLRPSPEVLSSVHKRGEMVLVQGQLMPLVRLYKLFGVIPSTEDPTESLLVVVEDNSNKCCLLVDELLGLQQVVIKSLGEGVGNVKGISGGAIMGDGRVSLILDVPGLMELAHET